MNTYSTPRLLSIDDLQPAEFTGLLALSRQLRWVPVSAALDGKTIVLIFEKPSLRTRVTFEVAVRRLGGWPVLLDGGECRLGERESIADMARNLSLWVDGIVARVFSHASLQELADFSAVPVVNALSDLEHPCQALADIITLGDVWDSFCDRTLVYVGDWNNVSRSLAKASALVGLQFRAVCPAGFGPAAGEAVDWTADLDGVAGADAVYTDVWTSMGQEAEFARRVEIFNAYQVNDDLLARTGKPTLFMHCLPAHRGLEVTDSVIDSGRSLVFQQAANRLPAEMAILSYLLERSNEATHQQGRPGILRRPGHIDHYPVAQGKLWM
jgi:ornithine carbamoyltransferase